MSDATFAALIGIAGTICTSIITAILGPIVVAYLQRQKPNVGSNNPDSGTASQNSENSNVPMLAIASLTLGVFNLCGWFIPICGLPMSILGLIFGFASVNSSRRGLAIAGMVLCIIGLILGVANAAIGAYQGATGQHPLFQ